MGNENTWTRTQRLINVTAIQTNGSPITCQMWDSSMADVAATVLGWHDDAHHKGIIRVFVSAMHVSTSCSNSDDLVASEWVVTPLFPSNKNAYRGITRVS